MKSSELYKKYIWQLEQWPDFRWDNDRLIGPLSNFTKLQGLLNGKMSVLGFNKKSQTQLDALTNDLVSSYEIEGLAINPQSLRSGIARKLGIEQDNGIIEDRYIEGLAEVMLDATRNCLAELTADRLFGWHCVLFTTGRSGMHKITVGDWRRGEEPMQVVSCAMGHEKVHYEAVPSVSVPSEMDRFIEWCNSSSIHPVIMSGLAHLWFVTIHPFDDGNGRISRIIADMFLSRLDHSQPKYYSVSVQINHNKKAYYEILERTQKGDLDVTEWLLWYIECLEQAVKTTDESIEMTLKKARYWDKFRDIEVNERQRKVVNRLWDGFNGKLTTSKWAKICHCSQDTALRDIKDLIAKGMLVAGTEGGRSQNYLLP